MAFSIWKQKCMHTQQKLKFFGTNKRCTRESYSICTESQLKNRPIKYKKKWGTKVRKFNLGQKVAE